jgi:hypothetical protein
VCVSVRAAPAHTQDPALACTHDPHTLSQHTGNPGAAARTPGAEREGGGGMRGLGICEDALRYSCGQKHDLLRRLVS